VTVVQTIFGTQKSKAQVSYRVNLGNFYGSGPFTGWIANNTPAIGGFADISIPREKLDEGGFSPSPGSFIMH